MDLLLHTCCANCALVSIETLKGQFNLTLFWYNPNIHPVKYPTLAGSREAGFDGVNPNGEYEKRLATTKKLAKIYQLPLIIDEYEDKKWLELTNGLESEPEGGRRCEICFKMRLGKTAIRATNYEFNTNIRKFSYFATTVGNKQTQKYSPN